MMDCNSEIRVEFNDMEQFVRPWNNKWVCANFKLKTSSLSNWGEVQNLWGAKVNCLLENENMY